jgi:hypothetical protein
MSVVQCEVCHSYYDDVDDHRCPGLRIVDWARFVGSLRKWMESDSHARFEVFYARRQDPATRDRAAGASGARSVVVDAGQATRVPRRVSIFCSACSRYCLKTG